jgi:signal recognition particle subunit SRP54
VLDEKVAQEQMEKMLGDRFSLEDFLDQLRTIRKLGSMRELMSHMPGMPEGFDPNSIDEKRIDRTQAVMLSMTAKERRRPELIDMSRKRRIARGSGTTVQDINQLLKQYREMRRMMKSIKGKWLRGALGG